MKQHAEGFLTIVQEAKKRVEETNVQTIKQRLDKGDEFYLVDVREESEWQQSRLPNAIHLSKGIIERDIEKIIPNKNAEIVLYCGGGFRSALATDNILKMGYTNAISMDGGFRAWVEAGYPTVK